MAANHCSTPDCIELMDADRRPHVLEALRKYKSKGVLIFSNHDMSSSCCGQKFAIGWGPDNTLQEVPADGKCRIAPPFGSAWQYYLDAYSDDLVNGAV